MRQQKRKRSKFKFAYVVYLSILALLAIAAIVYVKVLLVNYENAQPEHIAISQMDELSSMVKDGTIENYFPFPNVSQGKFEEGANVKEKYYEMLSSDRLTCVLESKELDGTKAVYKVKSGEVELASIALKSDGVPHQKLIIFVYYDWEVESITPIVKKQSYDVEIPADYTVSLNGIPLGPDELVVPEEGTETDESLKKYHIDGLYLQPEFRIVTPDGTPTDYNIVKNKVTPVIFDYTLVIPSSLSVTVNGVEHEGADAGGGMTRHAIREVTEPEVLISDTFGNTEKYAGGNDLPLTYKKITVPNGYAILADGNEIPVSSSVKVDDEELSEVRKYAEVPESLLYTIAILKDGAEIVVKDGSGSVVDISAYASSNEIDLCGTLSGAEALPDEISAQINVLEVAETWSKFMSADINDGSYGFYTMAQYLIEGSKLYDDAQKWANGVDITFTSIHTLGDPPFTDEKVTNYVRLSDNCFRCDISFVKHMFVDRLGQHDEPNNLRFWFVLQEGYAGSAWKVAYMKEIVD